MRFIAVIGDIVSSTQIGNRGTLQMILNATLNRLSHIGSGLASPYTITLGDEFQGLFRRADSLIVDAVTIMADMYPHRVRFAFGVGTIETEINPNQAIGMDGPAFHAARRGIREISNTRFLFNIRGLPEESEPLVREALMLISANIRTWKQNRLEMFTRLHRGLSVAEIAGCLELSAQAVYKAIDSADMKTILRLSNSITKWINDGLEET
jgi:hypothetical protein